MRINVWLPLFPLYKGPYTPPLRFSPVRIWLYTFTTTDTGTETSKVNPTTQNTPTTREQTLHFDDRNPCLSLPSLYEPISQPTLQTKSQKKLLMIRAPGQWNKQPRETVGLPSLEGGFKKDTVQGVELEQGWPICSAHTTSGRASLCVRHVADWRRSKKHRDRQSRAGSKKEGYQSGTQGGCGA